MNPNRLRIGHLAGIIVCIVLASCGQRHGVVNLSIVATSDTHGQIFDIDAVNGSHRKGSMAKVASFLADKRNASDNVVYVDCGDALQGSIEAYRDVTAEFFKPCLESQAYNLLGCKAVAMGNHDLIVGTNCYSRYFDDLDCPVLWGNLGFTGPGDYMPPYNVVTVNGVRVAFLGLTTPDVAYTIPSDIMIELNVYPMEQAARKWISVLREQEKADVIVGLLHAGIEMPMGDTVASHPEDLPLKLVQSVPGFDLVIYGHDHQACVRRVADANGDSLWLANPGAYCRTALTADITMDFSESKNPKPSICVSIEDMTSYKPDKEFTESLSDRWDDVCAYADSSLGVLGEPIDAGGFLWRETSALDYLHSFQMNHIAAEISLISCVQDTAVIGPGPIAIRDMFRIYPFDNNMVSIMLKGSEVRNILEYSADRYYNTCNPSHGDMRLLKIADAGTVPTDPANRFLTAAGIKYEVDVTKPFGRRVMIRSMADGTPFDEEKFYRTTITSFLFSGTESILPVATRISGKELQRRINVTSHNDIRYSMITQAALTNESGGELHIGHCTDWKLVPADVVSRCLAQDTVMMNLFN